MVTDKLISFINSFLQLNPTDVSLIDKAFEYIAVKKNDVLLEYEQYNKYLYFINTGFIRVFHFEKGLEITNHLAYENFVTGYNSFISKTPSTEVVHAISDCELLRITKDNLDKLYIDCPNMARAGILISDKYLVFNSQRAKDLITLSAEEKYKKLLKEEPCLVQNVPLQYISSYLGVKPQTLSRIRKNIFS